MRSTLALTLALLLAAACARLAGSSERVGQFAVDWNQARSPDDKPLLLISPDDLLDPSVAAVFGHPVVADAANTLFRPTLSDDARTTVRFAGVQGAALIPPVNADAGVGPLLRSMEQALRAAGRDVPAYLSLVADEYNPTRRETARFAVTCYWKGEQKLGVVPGVLATRTGSLGGQEVVEVEFDPTRLTRQTLDGRARSMACFRGAVPGGAGAEVDASNEQQYHLWLRKQWHYVPLTRLQATRVNAALVAGESPDRFLSATQSAIRETLQRAYDRDHRSLDALESLDVDRTPQGIVRYAKSVADRINSL